MSTLQEYADIYLRIKKRLKEYTIRGTFFTFGTLVFTVLFVFTIVPIAPIFIIAWLNISNIQWVLWVLWPICLFAFGGLFWLFQKASKNNETKYHVTLEEKAYVLGYEALCFLKEHLDKEHPILGSKRKAINRLNQIDYLFGTNRLPSVYIIREQAVQLLQFRTNLRNRFVPLIKRTRLEDSKTIEIIYSTLMELLDYLSKPKLDTLIDFNAKMMSLSENPERGLLVDFSSMVFRRSNLRHITVFSFSAISSLIVYYLDINYFGASNSGAFELGLMFLIGVVAIYVTYLGLSIRKEPKS